MQNRAADLTCRPGQATKSWPVGSSDVVCCVDYFPGGLFQYVRVVSLYDESPFEYEFVFRIDHPFLLMKELSLVNQKSQNHKQYQESQKNNENCCAIEY